MVIQRTLLVAVFAVLAWLLWRSSRKHEVPEAIGAGDDEPDPQRVFVSQFLHEAGLVAELLRAEGIEVTIKNEYLAGAVGEIPFGVAAPELWVSGPQRIDRAREIVAGYEARKKSELGPDRTCPSCGAENPSTFELCWRCRSPLEVPEPSKP